MESKFNVNNMLAKQIRPVGSTCFQLNPLLQPKFIGYGLEYERKSNFLKVKQVERGGTQGNPGSLGLFYIWVKRLTGDHRIEVRAYLCQVHMTLNQWHHLVSVRFLKCDRGVLMSTSLICEDWIVRQLVIIIVKIYFPLLNINLTKSYWVSSVWSAPGIWW